MGKNLILIDGHALAFRMFFALERTNMQTTDHTPTWAVFGFFKTIFDMLKNKKLKPDCIAVAFDVSKQTFRLEKYSEYKANRLQMPDSLRPQLGLIQEGLRALNIPIYTKEGFEGDDLIGTVATIAKDMGHKVYILTGDKDSFQLIDKEGQISVLIPSKGEIVEYNWDKVYEKLEIYPNQVIDYKALSGDTSDNIPGIKGIGPKSASALLNEYKTLDGIYENIENITKKALKEKLESGKEIAYLSQFLATIKKDVEIDFNFKETSLEIPDTNKVVKFFTKVQFYSFVRNINIILSPFQNCDCGSVLEPENIKPKPEHEEIKEIKEIKETKETKTETPTQIGLFGNIQDFEPYTGEISHEYFMDLMSKAQIKMNLELASYIKDSSRKHDLISQIQNYLGVILTSKTTEDDLIEHIKNLEKYFENTLSKEEKEILFNIEMPLRKVLDDMENLGIKLDTIYLKELAEDINGKIQSLEENIYDIAGEKFNISSPKQVGEILFNKLEIKPKKKNKTGFSTNAKVLEELSETHEIARKILEHRTLMKLKTTYIDVLPKLTDNLGRVHTHFNQIITTTGRLSSSDPNLQNIPIRTELGAKIRKAFIAQNKDTHSILSADYSQIELRLLAHISGDERLIQAFKDDVDIHTLTASKIFNTHEELVNYDMRRKAKAVNFGIIYGQTRYGLASALGISPFEAQDFIDRYFETYPKIRQYMNNVLISAHQDGFVETILGRKRYLSEELNSRNGNIREFAERAAINAPIQGSAADLIKIAMIKLSEKLKNTNAKLLLQVHDELILEVPDSELEKTAEIVKDAMENAMQLSVPIVADVKIGKSWKDE